MISVEFRQSNDSKKFTSEDNDKTNENDFVEDDDLQSFDEINFLIVTDLHFGGKKSRQESLFFNSIKNRKIDFIFILGDLVDTGFEDNYEESESFVKKIKSKLLQPDIPFYVLLGNHDLYQDGYDYWKELSFSTNKDASYFYFKTPINSEKTKFRSWYFLDTASGILGYNQLNNFKELVEKDKNPKIVLTHYPIYADMTMFDFFRLSDTRERALLIELCDKHNVDLVFSLTYQNSFLIFFHDGLHIAPVALLHNICVPIYLR